MRHSVLALLAIAATSASAQTPPRTIHGLPLSQHVPTPPPIPLSRLRTQDLRNIRTPSRVTFLPSYLYVPYAQQMEPQENIVINNYSQPAPVYLLPMAASYTGSFGIGETLMPRGVSGVGEPHAPVILPPPKSRRIAEPSDVNSLDAVVHAMYELLSGPSFKGRDWDRYRSLFVEDAHISVTVTAPGMPADVSTMPADDYIAKVAPEIQRGVFENEVSRKVEQSGRMAHVFSTFESRHNATDDKAFARGVNSIQLLNDGTRWWIVSLYSDRDASGNPVPPKGPTPPRP